MKSLSKYMEIVLKIKNIMARNLWIYLRILKNVGTNTKYICYCIVCLFSIYHLNSSTLREYEMRGQNIYIFNKLIIRIIVHIYIYFSHYVHFSIMLRRAHECTITAFVIYNAMLSLTKVSDICELSL